MDTIAGGLGPPRDEFAAVGGMRFKPIHLNIFGRTGGALAAIDVADDMGRRFGLEISQVRPIGKSLEAELNRGLRCFTDRFSRRSAIVRRVHCPAFQPTRTWRRLIQGSQLPKDLHARAPVSGTGTCPYAAMGSRRRIDRQQMERGWIMPL